MATNSPAGPASKHHELFFGLANLRYFVLKLREIIKKSETATSSLNYAEGLEIMQKNFKKAMENDFNINAEQK